ncbi:hypothetical protein [Limnobacter alexandrii]|uniref:hypothetical protein n=1 Tax=Limnobacter alexandrii TaxID=2570352 RepID=UPI001108462F|nr:hypothetical protein [Limnobacter alexandrii]
MTKESVVKNRKERNARLLPTCNKHGTNLSTYYQWLSGQGIGNDNLKRIFAEQVLHNAAPENALKKAMTPSKLKEIASS